MLLPNTMEEHGQALMGKKRDSPGTAPVQSLSGLLSLTAETKEALLGSQVGSVLSISNHWTLVITGEMSIAPTQTPTKRSSPPCAPGTVSWVSVLVLQVHSSLWTPWKQGPGIPIVFGSTRKARGEKSSRSLKHILTSSLNIRVQSLSLCSSTSCPRGTSGNPTYLSLFLLGTNITTAPQFIHFTLVLINFGAVLTFLPQVGSGKEERARLGASLHMLLCVFHSTL